MLPRSELCFPRSRNKTFSLSRVILHMFRVTFADVGGVASNTKLYSPLVNAMNSFSLGEVPDSS